MTFITLSLKDFSTEIDTKMPTPGSGAVTAYSSHMAMGLIKKLCYLSIDMKSFDLLPIETQEQFRMHFDLISIYHDRMLQLVDEDARLFQACLNSFKQPDLLVRNSAIQAIIDISFEMILGCYECVKLSVFFLEYANEKAIADLACGLLLLESGLACASLNLNSLLTNLQDLDKADAYKEKVAYMLSHAKELVKTCVSEISQRY